MKLVHRLLLIILSAALVTFSFEPFAFRFFALVAWAPLLMALRDLTLRPAFRLGLLHGMLVIGGTLSWTYQIFSTLAPVLWFILALFSAFFSGLSTQKPIQGNVMLTAVTWTGLEYFRGELFWLHFPWITPSTALPPNLFTPWVGVYGVSFFVILAAGFLISKTRSQKIAGGFLIIILGLIPPFDSTSDNSATSKVALVQNESMNYDNYRIDTQEIQEQVDFIVWPEYAIGIDPRKNPNSSKEISDLLKNRASHLISGGKTWHDDHGDDYSNSAFTFNDKRLLGTHVKNRHVHFFEEGRKGIHARSQKTSLGTIGTPICFDCDHQDVVRRMTNDGAHLFLIPSLDAKHWTKRQHLQHGQLFRHRAAENGRWLAISSTSGLTQIINPQGVTTAQIPLMDEGILIGEVSWANHYTLFQRGGWLLAPCCLILMLIIAVMIIFINIRRNKS